MSEEKVVNQTSDACYSEFVGSYTDRVHVIGRATLAIAAVLSFLPIAYLVFVKGYTAPLSDYILVFTTIAVVRVGMWISEPFTWYPVLGSAPLYISYYSGNAKNLRVPVAQNLQSKYNVEVMTPKGQVITTIGVGVSVFVNVALLAVIVVLGNAILPYLPGVVLDAFDYVIPALIGALMSNHLRKRGLVKTILWVIPGLVVLFLTRVAVLPAKYGTSLAIAATVIVGYIVFVMEGKKESSGSSK